MSSAWIVLCIQNYLKMYLFILCVTARRTWRVIDAGEWMNSAWESGKMAATGIWYMKWRYLWWNTRTQSDVEYMPETTCNKSLWVHEHKCDKLSKMILCKSWIMYESPSHVIQSIDHNFTSYLIMILLILW